ncbi:MAG: hypothetical protein FWG83_07025 [Oscillospiraceae bacterium]|nr:hypothetical protein [Oscillospiraceae bacterium]
MKFKKAFSCVTAAAVGLGMAAVMATVVGASDYSAPTYDSKTGGWVVNDFRRVVNDFENNVGILPAEVKENPETDAMVPLFLPEGKTLQDIKFVKVEFDFPEDTELEEIPVVNVCINSSAQAWQQHAIHIDPEISAIERCNAAGNRTCGRLCKWEEGTDKPTIIAPVDLVDPYYEEGDAEYAMFMLTLDWAIEDQKTPGTANITLLDENRNLLALSSTTESYNPGGNEEITTTTDGTGNGGTQATTVAGTTAAATTTASGDTPKGGVVLAIIPTIMATGAVIALSKKRK